MLSCFIQPACMFLTLHLLVYYKSVIPSFPKINFIFIYFSVVKEEIIDEDTHLPCFNGRVVSWVCIYLFSPENGPVIPCSSILRDICPNDHNSIRCTLAVTPIFNYPLLIPQATSTVIIVQRWTVYGSVFHLCWLMTYLTSNGQFRGSTVYGLDIVASRHKTNIFKDKLCSL